MALAGGFVVGDRVACRSLSGTVVGGPARAACIRLSVAVRYDDGRIADERVANIELVVDDGPDDDDDDDQYEDQQQQQIAPPADEQGYQDQQQQAASQAMWAQPAQAASPAAPACFAADNDEDEEATPADSPQQPEYDDERDVAPPPRNDDAPGAGGGFGPDEAEAAVRDKIYRNYEDLRAAFRALDQSNNGYVSREDFFQAMGNIFLQNGFAEDDVYEVADRFDLNKDGYISYDEFVSVVEGDQDEAQEDQEEPPMREPDPRLITAVELAIQKFKSSVDQRYGSIRKAFLALDTERRSTLSPVNFAKGLTSHGILLQPSELELAWSLFDRTGAGVISYTDFAAVMTQRLQFGNHLGRQMFM
jgi:Ca2+-binding EF-hand superfamily protein